MRRLQPWVPAFVFGLALANASACASLLEVDDFQDATTASGGAAGGGGLTGGGGDPGAPCGGDDQCVALPGGWNGPVIVAETNQATPIECPAGTTDVWLFHADLVPGGGCEPCACEALCDPGKIDWWGSPGCPGTKNGSIHPNITSCHGSFAIWSATMEEATTTCEFSGGAPAFTASWAKTATLCAATPADGTCAEGSCTVPPPAGDFLAGLCVWKLGAETCPAEFGADRIYYYENGIDDTRSCSACGCNVTQDCRVQLNLYLNLQCQPSGPQTVVAPFSCEDMTVDERNAIRTVEETQALCEAVGATETGEATPDPGQAVTVCCR